MKKDGKKKTNDNVSPALKQEFRKLEIVLKATNKILRELLEKTREFNRDSQEGVTI